MSFFSSCFYCFAPKATEREEEKVLFDDDGDEISEKTNQVTLENVENEENDEKMNTDKTETYEDNSRKDETNKNKNNKRNKDSERDKKKKTSGSANNNEEENDRNSLSSNTGSSNSSTSSTNYNAQMKTPPQVANRRLGSLKLTPSVQKLSIIMDDKEHEQLNQYIMIKDLGRGAHAKVKLGLNKMDNN